MVQEMLAAQSEQPVQGPNKDAPSPVESDACDILMSLRHTEAPPASNEAQQEEEAGREAPPQEQQQGGEAPMAHRKRGRLSIVSSMKMEDISGYFHLNLKDAAAALGISVNTLKRVCRKLNIPKWPYRELKWMDKHRGKMQSYLTQHTPGDRASGSETGGASSENDAATDEGNSSIRSERRREKAQLDVEREDEVAKRSPRGLPVPAGLKLDQYSLARAVAAGMPQMQHRAMSHVDRVPYSSGMLPTDSTRPYMVPSEEYPYSAAAAAAAAAAGNLPRTYMPYMNQHSYGMGYPHPAAHNYYREQLEYQSRMWNMCGYMPPSNGLGPAQQAATAAAAAAAGSYPDEYMHPYQGRMTEEQFRMAKRQRRDLPMDYASVAAGAAAAGMAKDAAASAPGLYPTNFKAEIPSPEMIYGAQAAFSRGSVAQSRAIGPVVAETAQT